MSSIIDSHCHLERFYNKGELVTVLKECAEVGVDRLITVGTGIDDWDLYVKLGAEYSGVIDYTIGIHPCDVDEGWEAHAEKIPGYFDVTKNRPVALGEIGLDYFHLPKKDEGKAQAIKKMQHEALRVQLAFAKKEGCPIVIHSRGAFPECIEELDAAGIDYSNVVFHCFVENGERMKLLNDRGGRGSFTGVLTFKNADEVREAAFQQGIDKVMVETDAPYLAPMPHRGKPCHPAYTALTAKYCSELLGVDYEAFAQISRRNTEEFFSLK